MQRHIIPLFSVRLTILVVALISISLPAFAVMPDREEPPKGTGSASDTYLVSTVKHFMYITSKPSAKYKQVADLDFAGYEFDSTNGNSIVNAVFTGTYDGDGHIIKNVIIDWSKKFVVSSSEATHSYIGIFRNIGSGGKVRNLLLDNISLNYTYKDENNIYKGNNNELGIELGILCGSAYKGAEIENIIVRNSTINANGDPHATNYFIGGLVGDVRETATQNNAVSITIKNISVNVDIFLPDCTRDDYASKDDARPHQFLVGGIVGRLRTVSASSYPINTLFQGEIKAPIAMIGPCYGGARYDQKNKGNGYFTSVYAGQIANPGAPGNENPNDMSVLGMDGTGSPDLYRYYSNYKVWHYDADASGNLKCDVVTDAFPSNADFSSSEKYYYGTRTFRPNYPYSDKTVVNYTSAKDMASFQGVNHGTYVSDLNALLGVFNQYVDNSSKALTKWHYIPEHGFAFSSFAIIQTDYDKFSPKFSSSAEFNLEDYKIKWTLTKIIDDGNTSSIEKSSSSDLCISDDFGPTENDVNRYKSVKAELINKDGDTEFSYVIDLSDIDCLVVCRFQGSYVARVRSPWNGIEYRFHWYLKEGSDVLQESLTPLTRESEFSVSSDSKADNIVVEICDKNGNIYHYFDNTPARIELDITGNAPDAKLELTREKSGNSTYFVARVYDSDNNLISGGCPVTDLANYIGKSNVQYVWECTTDPSNTHNFTKISNSESYFKGYVTETYYKVTAYYNGWELAYAFCGNKDVIFVYDADKHAEAETLIRNDANKSYFNDTPLSSFDGKDRWTDKDGEHDDSYFPNGDDTNDGRNPNRAVKSLQQAYKLLDFNNGPDNNIIVVMGFNYDEYLFDWTRDKAKYDEIYNRAATITGKYGKIDGGAIVLSNHGDNPIGLRGATKFENITLVAIPEKAKNGNKKDDHTLFLYANLHDLTFGENVVMRGYRYEQSDHGLIDTFVPNITIVVGVHNFNETNGDISSYKEKCKWNQDKDFTTLTIQSGSFGRIMGGARNNGDTNSNCHNIFGNNSLPHRVRINIDITHNASGDDIFKEYCPDLESKYDIGLLAGGQTDGSVYSEAELSMNAGTVGRFISGNITFCRATDVTNDGVTTYYPYDSYFGSTVFNFRGGDIKELYGGSLGRIGGNMTGNLKAYFYGRSIINIEGGTISSSLCGAGAGGVAGVGTDIKHTDDIVIPYVDVEVKNGAEVEVLKYGDYDTSKGKVATMPLSDGSILDFNKTFCEVNVKSGTVKGNIYGAGGGESSVIGNSATEIEKLSPMTGWLFGDCRVNISEDEGTKTIINGDIYGAGMGSKKYYTEGSEPEYERKGALAQLHGNSSIEISGGTITGSVYAAGMGIEARKEMAALYGSASLKISGGSILGNIYGGSKLADVHRFELSQTEALARGDDAYSEGEDSSKKYYLKGSGDTNIIIDGGVIGNCIFGGSEGKYVSASSQHKSVIDGDTHVTINGGEFIDTPYMDIDMSDFSVPDKWNVEDTPDNYRNFNIYGGGNKNCDVAGTAYIRMYTSLLNSEKSFVPKSQNPNAVGSTSGKFKSAYDDITYRRFCVYGGGYGENTTVGNTDVYVNIPPERMGVTLPHGNTLDSYLPQQSFFDIAGGGYAGNVGYWVNTNGDKLTSSSTIDDYVKYVDGNCKVTIDGYTYARKIIGGGFYGTCNNTNTHVRCGSLRQVYGGSLLGDVHKRAYLQFGNRIEDFIRKVGDSYVYDENGLFSTEGEEYEGDKTNAASVWDKAAARAKALNDYIFITENIYGGNDVKGIIGTKKLISPVTGKSYALVNEYPLFCTDDGSILEDCGIVFNIYGGTFMGDVYGAGNGHYRGYYVPEWVRYTDGPAHLYRTVIDGTDASKTSKVYDGRPMVGNVNINIRGNSEIDRIHFTKNFYGGGRECTIGQWNTLLPAEDPRRLVKGGHLHVNFGGFTDIDGNVYMGSEGSLYAKQPVVPEKVLNFDIYKSAESKKTSNIDALGDIAYYHWYYDDTNDVKRYLPGFPPKDKVDGNYGFTGEHMFRAYLKNIEMECDVELTFYRNLYKRNASTNRFEYEMDGDVPMEDAYGTKLRLRKRWIPYEMAVAPETPSTTDVSYDASDITMTSFFLGGACGSMSNNQVMNYTYQDDNTDEKWPSIYRVSLPKGVLIKDALVMGSQDAEIKTYGYADNSSCKSLDTDLLYSFKGGMVTHSSIAFDLIVYNDMRSSNAPLRDLPAGFYDSDNPSDDFTTIYALNFYTIKKGADAGTTVYRRNYSKNSKTSLSSLPDEVNYKRYDFAVLNKESGNTAYIGARAKREGSSDHLTVVKLGASCTFQPQFYDDGTLSSTLTEDEKHAHRYGGIIYGGCYSSGITIGDVVLNVASDMLGAHYPLNSEKAYGEFSRLKYYKGRVYGGGYGQATDVQGNTYVNLINKFRGMNVFGGGMMGTVSGTAHVTYIGEETESYIYGAIYGGGLLGDVGIQAGSSDATAQATVVRLFSGNVDKVYGGSCMANLYGRTFVELADEVQTNLDHLDYGRLRDKGYNWWDSRLIVGTVYGGNDIAGNIYPISPAPAPADPPKDYEAYRNYSSSVFVHEIQNTSAKDTPGSIDGFNGFPLIGSLYGGSNGNYGEHLNVDGTMKYSAGTVYIANGDKTNFETIDLRGAEDDYSVAKVVPVIDKAMVDIKGGTIIDAYTGGNMATLTEEGKIYVEYRNSDARAGFEKADELNRVWNALHLSSDMQLDEVIEDYHKDKDEPKKFEYNIFRLFGGNDNATMAIQPTVDLRKGDLGSVYSGGNFGMMTYYKGASTDTSVDPPVSVPEEGLSLTISSDDIKIDNVYGGGRLGDIVPDFSLAGRTTPVDSKNFYGATLNIEGGKIQHIYGGNDVAGYIYNGTKVNISGAIAGDVYCAGNGDYTYKYDRKANICSYPNPKIMEDYEAGDNAKGTRYFILPAKSEYGYDDPSDAQVVMAVNSYRPHVERAQLNIGGSASHKVWVGGNVYCGGNSATVTKKGDDYDLIFNIGDYVTLNGVFLGSNGENLALGSTIQKFEDVNGLDMTVDNDLSKSNLPEGADWTAVTAKETLYPKLLDLYMRAVETTQQPKGFAFSESLEKAYIGEFCIGGNRGSIMTDKKISIDFPESLNIYGRIIGGSKNANVTYNGVTHIGGLTVPLDGDETVKVDLKVRSKFLPLQPFSDLTDPSGFSLRLCMVDEDGTVIPSDIIASTTKTKYYKDKHCNVYGGCFTSGKTVGGINIDFFSDMINYEQIDKDYNVDGLSDAEALEKIKAANKKGADPENPEYIDRQAIINDITHPESWRNFTIVGAGYGADTEVWGDINVRMLPTVKTTTVGESTVRTVKHPSVSTIFGGSQEGLVVGNTNVEIRDGRVFTNVYGASEAAKMYGSTSVIVGYPRYYRAIQSGNYRITRADYMSDVAVKDLCDEFGEVVVPKAVAYRKGDIVPENVYDMMLGRIKDSRIQSVIDDDSFKMGKSVEDVYVDLILDTNKSDYFSLVTSKTKDDSGEFIDHIVPGDFDATWEDIEIWVGDQNSNINDASTFFGQGNIYGGGYIPNSSDRTLIGQPTIMRFTDEYNNGLVELDSSAETSKMEEEEIVDLRKKVTALYGGNTSVIMWDNMENADYSKDLTTGKTADNSSLKDHVHIGTGYFKNVNVSTNSSVKGLFKKLEKEDAYIYQTVGKVDADALDRYYEKIADGGVYGGGRKVFAQAFRSIDLAYYGYAEHTPQTPKLLNTIQRADVATIKDCCMDLVGASDFTLSDYKDIYYAINRVGELRMVSSLNKYADLDSGKIDSSTGDGIRIHKAPRSRNFMALYNRTNHLAAFKSNWNFEDIYHLSDGITAGLEADDYITGAYPAEGDKVSYVNRKHRYIDVYTKYHQLYLIDETYKNAVDKTGLPQVTENDILELNKLYKACTGNDLPTSSSNNSSDSNDSQSNDSQSSDSGSSRADDSDSDSSTVVSSKLTDDIKNTVEDLWKQRNKGTSGNMIGINSGYELSIEGLACQRGESSESRYYGPAYGVTEIKILTTVSGMGGGYIYALNHHYDPLIDGTQAETNTKAWCAKFGRDFLNTTGNFVFPGANYNTSVDNVPTTKFNYIIDDCFDHYDPINHGYFECVDMGGHDRVITKAPARGDVEGSGSASEGTSVADVNNAHEIHYWYVSGNTYVYNVTITGITSDTSPDAPRNFYIDNTNGLVNLFNIKEGTDVKVDEVMWFEHENGGIEDCDLTHHDPEGEDDPEKQYLSTQYKLYLTVFDNTRNKITDDVAHPGAYAIRIPRHSYLRDDNEALNGQPINKYTDYLDRAFVSDEGVTVRPNMGVDGITVNHYTSKYTNEKGELTTNHPLLGVRLVDGQKNRLADQDRAAGIEYYNKHLAGDHNVQVTLNTRNGSDQPIFYIINIDICYLMGPALFGDIEIENCALPGEYIYVNAENVEVLMDENLGVSKQAWRMYPNIDGKRITKSEALKNGVSDPDIKYDDTYQYAYYDLDKDPYILENTDKVIHIPAYHYQDGWEVAYEVVANGEYFESVLPYYGTKEVGDPENPGKNITVTDYDNILYGNRLRVHNYHRMKPMYKGSVLDLLPTEDARIYIEDKDDIDYFFEYLDKMQTDPVASGYKRFTLPTGLEVNPQYCDSLDFYLMKPLNVPNSTTAKNLEFAGRFHGMGHNLTIPEGTRYSFINKGRFHNLGFISNSTIPDSHAFSQNLGSLYNCFYFNPKGFGSFLGGDAKNIADNHRIANCYENTLDQAKLTSLKYNYDEILHLSTEGFRYGQAAYNLNGYYLKKRHILLHGPSASDSWTTENNSFALADKDVDLRKNAESYTPYEVPYIESYYNNGDYRYAWVTSSTHPEGLRSAAMPNYLDRLNNRKNGLPVSMHDATPDSEGRGLDGHRIDETRWCDTHKEYHPQFDSDYIFFGQDQTIDVDDDNKTLPCAVTPETRVYRVGGFYGSAADKGYYFNRHAYLDSPLLTAVDFVGYRDRDLYDDSGMLNVADRADIDDNGWVIKQTGNVPTGTIRTGGWHEVYYAPSIDLPWEKVDGVPMHNFDKFTLIDSKVTHNLLVYTRDNDRAAGYLTDYHYNEDFKTTPFQYHSDAGIKLHHIVDHDKEGPVIFGDYFHLVDGYDFNAPVAFKVKQGWYTRQPSNYADTYVMEEVVGNIVRTETFTTAWETICLPFDVAKTYAATSNRERFKSDMGEITHFYNDDYKGHEYWLRRLTDDENVDGSDRLYFERPKESNRQGSLPDKVGNLMYENSMLHDLYINAEYQEDHDELYHDSGVEWPRKLKNYRYLTGGVPYIVNYPGKGFYEFDLSGNFYYNQDADHRYEVPQSISYFVKQDDTDDSYVTIPISDYLINGASKYTSKSGNFSMTGTFAHATNEPSSASVLYKYVPQLYVVNTDGTMFEEAKSGTDVQPFHAYVSKAASIGASRGLIIGGDVVEYKIEDIPEEPDEDAPEQIEHPDDGIRVWTEGSKLLIYTPENLEACIYNMSGQVVRRIRAYEGTNRYSGILPGFYIVLHHKFFIPYQ